MIKHLYNQRELITSFVKRDLIGRYRGSFLGILWSFINPLFMLLIYTIVFSVLFGIRPGSEKIPYSIFLFTGLVPWIAFSEALTHSTGIIYGNINLVKKVLFPLEILPVVVTITGFIHSLIALLILLTGVIILEHNVHSTIFILPVIIIPQLLLTVGLSWFLASFSVFVRDMGQIIGLGLTGWMYLTPILYPADMIPKRLRLLWSLNPMYGVVEGYRNLLLNGILPDYGIILWTSLISIIVTLLGYSWFMKTKKAFADVI